MRAVPVVNHILRIANRDKIDLTPLKMQKMLFVLHGWYFAITGQKLVDEAFEAWEYGPVVADVYNKLRAFGSLPIDDYIKEWDVETGQLLPYFVNLDTRPEFAEILERVWQEYSRFSTTQLSTMTHKPNTPWANTAPRSIIADEEIRRYFQDPVRRG